MARPRTVHLPTDLEVLERIQNAYTAALDDLKATDAKVLADYNTSHGNERYLLWLEHSDLYRGIQAIEERGVDANLATFAGRELTPTERLGWQRIVRRLVDGGLLVRDGIKIRPNLPEPEPTTAGLTDAPPITTPPAPEGASKH